MMEGCQKCHVRDTEGSHGVREEKRLELKLGPPGEDQQSLLSLGYTSYMYCSTDNNNNNNNENTFGPNRGFMKTVEANPGETNWLTKSNEIQRQKLLSSEKPVENNVLTSAWSCGPLPSPAFQSPAKPSHAANSSMPNSSHKRAAPAQVVGWPPVRSFRKNLAYGSSAKIISDSPSDSSKEVMETKSESPRNGLFVKINMDGVPIGRKIDLNAYESYEKLSYAIDELFRGLLAAQGDCSAARCENEMEETMIMGLLHKREEYTLVYEDNEGDIVLVGDVPWHMFVSTAKRLRVLRTSDLSTVRLGSSKQEKDSTT